MLCCGGLVPSWAQCGPHTGRLGCLPGSHWPAQAATPSQVLHANTFKRVQTEKKPKVYAVRCHHGSLCTQGPVLKSMQAPPNCLLVPSVHLRSQVCVLCTVCRTLFIVALCYVASHESGYVPQLHSNKMQTHAYHVIYKAVAASRLFVNSMFAYIMPTTACVISQAKTHHSG